MFIIKRTCHYVNREKRWRWEMSIFSIINHWYETRCQAQWAKRCNEDHFKKRFCLSSNLLSSGSMDHFVSIVLNLFRRWSYNLILVIVFRWRLSAVTFSPRKHFHRSRSSAIQSRVFRRLKILFERSVGAGSGLVPIPLLRKPLKEGNISFIGLE